MLRTTSARILRSSTPALRTLATEPASLKSRSLATEASSRKSPRPVGQATVEELHNMTANDILAEREGGKAGTMRHFTVNFGTSSLQ